jgi:hypothetical protein
MANGKGKRGEERRKLSRSARKPPSRVRYEQRNPTVSCRLSRDIRARLEKVKKLEGKSFADILKTGLGILEIHVREKETARKAGQAEGYRRGYSEAERLYKVNYPCNMCGKMLIVTSRDEKEAIKEYMKDNGWGHQECHERSQ